MQPSAAAARLPIQPEERVLAAADGLRGRLPESLAMGSVAAAM